MRAPLSWLRDYAPLDADVDHLADVLSGLGLVVEGVERIGGGLDDIVVAGILDIRAIPGADQIRVVDVDAGDGQALEVVCGAWNFAVGDLIPLAPVGAVLPGGLAIGRRKMRGQWSNGMLCSATELGLPDDGSDDGILILPTGLAAPGTPLVVALDLRPDVVFDLDISPNRPDALCMAGVARDLAGALGEPWSRPEGPGPVAVDATVAAASVTVDAGDLCPRFTAAVLEGVPGGASPAWMARRLTLAGMRPISLIVDVSNYVMLDVGQPNHAYDLDRLGGGGLLVRRGEDGETLVTLDGVERTLQSDDCVICDATGSPVGVGGIMGGSQAEIGPETTRVLLEAAWFAPVAIARTGVRLGLHSEARVRFERGVDPEVAGLAVERFVSLLGAETAGLRRGPTLDLQDPALPRPPRIRLRTARVNAILGTALEDADVRRLLESIGFGATPDGPGIHQVDVPPWRLESEREIDLIEEVARMWGYRQIARTLPSGARTASGGLTAFQRERRQVRQILVGAGYDEAWTTTFLAPGDLERAGLDPAAVEVENPLDRSESILRTALLPGLLKAVRFNVDRQAAAVCLFEIGHVFARPEPGSELPVETEALGAVVAVAGVGAVAAEAAVRTWQQLADALRIAGTRLEPACPPGWHPTRTASVVSASGAVLGTVGEIDPDVVAGYDLDRRVGYLAVSLDRLLAEPRLPAQARDVSRYPASDVDLAFVVDDSIPAAVVAATLDGVRAVPIESVTLFDVYRGESVGAGRRSLAFRLRYRAPDRTLSDSELARARSAAIEAVVAAHRAELRG
jgi:phenylalanyl-tRNA synthetase beta chain